LSLKTTWKTWRNEKQSYAKQLELQILLRTKNKYGKIFIKDENMPSSKLERIACQGQSLQRWRSFGLVYRRKAPIAHDYYVDFKKSSSLL
jgi:hypothetical protein